MSAEQAFLSLAELLVCVARDRPVQIWFDDLDRGSLECEFVGWVLDEPSMPLHIVATGVSDFAGCGWLDRAEVDVVDVPPLSDIEIEVMLHKHVHLPPGIAARVIERAGGSPLFALQLMDHWMARGAIKSVGGRLVMEDHEEELPANINLLWSRRVAHVVRRMPDPDLAMRTLEVAAVLGEVFEQDALTDVCSELGFSRCDGLEDLMESHGLWRRNASGFAFCHRLLRESVLRSAEERPAFASTHAACARIIGRLYQAQHPQIALRIAHHLSEAGQWQAAIVAARHAAKVARQSFDVRALLMCTASWERCLDGMKVSHTASQRIDQWTMRSYAYLLDAAPENRRVGFSLLEQAKAALSGASRIKDRARYAARAAIAALYGYMPTTNAYADVVAVLESTLDDELRFECEVSAARLAGANGDVPKMNDHATRAWGAATSPLETMQALQILARGHLELGDVDLAHDAIEKARHLALAANAVVAEARCLETAGFIADAREDFDAAVQCHTEALRLFTLATPRTSYPHVEREYLARALLAAGRFEDAYQQLGKVRHAYELGKTGYNTHFHEALVAACLGLGRYAEAQRWLAPAVAFTGHRHHELHWRALAIGVNLAARAGQASFEKSLRETLSSLVGHEEAERWISRTKEVGR
ncbi:MAG: hypothetical protein R3E66_22305 [bacterium]